jgi:hypothetical protein
MSDQLKEKIIELVNEDEEFKQKLKQEINSEESDETEVEKIEGEANSLSRRDFLKGALGGAGALGAAAMIPSAASYDITSSHPFSIYNSTDDKNFEVDTQGTLTTNQIGAASNRVSNIYGDSIDVDQINNATVVKSGSELQTALNNGDSLIRVSGQVTATDLTVPIGTVIFGHGGVIGYNDEVKGDAITGSASQLLKTESDVRIFGLAMKNDSGDAIRVLNGTCQFRNLTIHVSGKAFNLDTADWATSTVENIIESCTIRGIGPGTTGIDIVDYTDTEIKNCIIENFDKAVSDSQGTTRISGNHFYATQTSSVEIDAPNVHVTDNYLEASSGELITDKNGTGTMISNNLLRVMSDNLDSIHFDFPSSQNLSGVELTGNNIGATNATGGTAIETTNVSGVNNSTIESNVVKSHSSKGLFSPNNDNMGVSSTLSSAQQISNTSLTVLSFDSERWDQRDEFDTSTNTFTAANDGKYLVNAQLRYQDVSDGTKAEVHVIDSGDSRLLENYSYAGAAGDVDTSVMGVLSLSEGDTLRIQTYHNSGSAVYVDDAYTKTRFDVRQIA